MGTANAREVPFRSQSAARRIPHLSCFHCGSIGDQSAQGVDGPIFQLTRGCESEFATQVHADSASAVAVASVQEKSSPILQTEALEAPPVQSAADLPLTSIKAEQIVKIAHDFNNLLTLVLGYGEAILISLPANHPVCQYANQICDAAREGARLSSDLSAVVQSRPPQS